MEQDAKMLQTRLLQLEVLLSQATKIQSDLIDKLPDEEKKVFIESSEEISKLSNEYAKVYSLVNVEGTRSEKTAISREYRSIKELLADIGPAQVITKLKEESDCWTSCETCITFCIQCVTSIGLDPSNHCNLSTVMFSHCKPITTIGDVMGSFNEIDEMYVKWTKE